MRRVVALGLLVVMLWTTTVLAGPIPIASHVPEAMQVGFGDKFVDRLLLPVLLVAITKVMDASIRQFAWDQAALDQVVEFIEAELAPRAVWVQYLVRANRVAGTTRLCDVALSSESHNQHVELGMFDYCQAFMAEQEQDAADWPRGPHLSPQPK